MQLIQLSDIHVGSFFKQQVFDTVVEEVNKLNPDAIIITGQYCEYKKGGKTTVDMKTVGGKRTPLAEIVEKYKPYLEI